jgi:hypothetical protein
MNNIINKVIYFGVICSFCILILLGAYARIWEKLQPTQHITKTILRSFEPYSSTNELHWSYRGFKVYIVGEDRPIDFPLKNWDTSVQEGDTVDLIVRQSFQWFGFKDELDGLLIDDHK